MPLDVVSCAVCGSERSRRAISKFGLDIARCHDCGFLFSNPRLPAEDIRKRYSPEYFWGEYLPAIGVVDGNYDPAVSAARHGPLLDLIVSEQPPPARLFEIGTGAGSFLDAARARGYAVEGIEYSSEAARFAREKLGLAVREGEAEQLELSGRYDVVVAFETLEHVLAPRSVLGRVLQVLEPGGLLALSVPNLSALSRRLLGSDWAVFSPAEHLSYFDERTLGRLLGSVGFVSTRFVRGHPGFGAVETMNAACTNRPGAWRQLAYSALTRLLGRHLLGPVRALGWGDTLLCLTRSDGSPPPS